MTTGVLFGVAACVAGCSGYLLPDAKAFEAQVLSSHPVGSSVAPLRKMLRSKGFQSVGEPFNGIDQRYSSCMSRNVSYGVWAGGRRFLCYDQSNEKTLKKLIVFDLVAGL